jgi:hypothetical protein
MHPANWKKEISFSRRKKVLFTNKRIMIFLQNLRISMQNSRKKQNLINEGLKHDRNSPNGDNDQFLNKSKEGLLQVANMQVMISSTRSPERAEENSSLGFQNKKSNLEQLEVEFKHIKTKHPFGKQKILINYPEGEYLDQKQIDEATHSNLEFGDMKDMTRELGTDLIADNLI